MIIKTFTANSMAAALKLVRSELGRESVVLKTREIPVGPDGGRVEITACTERPLPAPAAPAKAVAAPARTAVKPFAPPQVANRLQASNVAPVPDPLSQRLEQIEAKLNRLATAPEFGTSGVKHEPLRSALRNADVPNEIIDELLGLAAAATGDKSDATAQIRARLTERLSNLIAPTVNFVSGDRVLFFGPAGAGKTSALGKLAARLVFQEKQKVTLVSLDAMKVGAAEEIQSYGDIIGSTVQSQEDASSAQNTNGITLIDTSALPRHIDQVATLRSQIDSLRANYRFAVFSATMRSDDIADFAQTINAIGPSHIIMTGLDLTDRWGGLFAASAVAGQLLVFTSNTPGGIGALIAPDAAVFVKKLLETEEVRG